MKKRERKKLRNLHLPELVLYCDFLSDEEQQIFLDKMQQYGRPSHFDSFIERFKDLENDEFQRFHEDMKKDFLKLENGFAALSSNAGSRFAGMFYVLLDDDFYKVMTNRKPDPKQKDSDFNHNKETQVTAIYKNGFELFKDEKLQELFEIINQKFGELHEIL